MQTQYPLERLYPLVGADEAKATRDLNGSIVERLSNLSTDDLRPPERTSGQTAYFRGYRELIPFFKTYAEKLLRAYTRAYIDQRWAPDDCVDFLADTVIPSVIDQMLPEETFSLDWYSDQVSNWDKTPVFPLSGVWERTLSDCGSAIAGKARQQDKFLELWDSKYVRQLRLVDNANHFRRQIGSHLEPHINDWFDAAWQGKHSQPETIEPPEVLSDKEADLGRPRPKRTKPGPKPMTEHHKKLAGIVAPYDERWNEDDNLKQVCRKLDRVKIPIPKKWPHRPGEKARNWSRMFDNNPDLVVKVIRERLRSLSGA